MDNAYSPKDVILQGYNKTSWDNLKSYTCEYSKSQPTDASKKMNSFNIKPNTGYNSYRLLIKSVQSYGSNVNYCVIDELYLYGR